MALDVETIGLAMDTSGVERGIKSLDELASRGPKVEQSLKGVENAAKHAGQGVGALGSTNAQGLEKVGTASQQAAQGLGKMGQAAQSAVSSQAALARAVDSFTQAENKYIQSLLDEAKQIGMTRAERAAYIAQSRGMSQSAQEIAAAVGKKIDALKREQEELGRLNKATGDTSDSLVSLARVGVQAFVGSVLVSGIKSASQAMYEASAQAERFRTTLNFATGGRGAQEIDYLRRVTGELGLQFASTAQAYSGFQAAARGTALEGQKAKDVFESIAKASAVMGLSAEQSGGVLLALQQMISKGTVQAEELRGQLGERLPGAFQIAAKAMGVTTAELGKMLEQGQVVASDFLPKFAKALEENLGGAAEKAADRLDAATNRYANALDRLKQSAGDSGISQFWAGQINILTDGMQGVANAMDMARAQGKGFAGQMAAAAGAAAQFANPLNALSYSAQDAGIKLKDAEARLEELRAAGAKGSSNLMLREAYSHAQRLVDKYREAKAAQDALLGGGGGADPRDIPATMTRGASYARWAQEQKESEQKMLEIRMRQSGVNKQYLQELKDLEQALARQVITQDEYTQRVSALAKTTWDASVAGKAAAKTSSERASAAKAEQSTYDKLISSIQTKIAQNEQEIASSGRLTESDKLRIKLMAELDAGAKNLTASHKASALALLEKLAAQEREMALAKSAVAAYREQQQIQEGLNRAYVDQDKARTAARIAVMDYARGIDESNDALKYEISLMGLSERAREIALEHYRIELDLKKKIAAVNDPNNWLTPADREEEIARLTAAATIAKANASSRVFLQEWKDSVKQYDDIFRQGFADMLNRGEDGWKSFTKSLATTFKTTVADTLYKAFAQPFVVRIVGQLMGLTGGVGGAAVQAASGGSNVLGTASNVASLFGAGGIGGSLMAGAGWLTGATTFGGALGAGASLIGTGTMAGAMSGIGMIAGAMGPIALGVAALTSLISSLDDSGTPHAGAGAVYSGGKVTGGRDVYSYDRFNLADMNTYSDQVQGLVSPVAQSIGAALDAFATAFGQQAGYTVSTAFADDSSKDASWGALRIEDALGQVLVDWNETRQSKWSPREFADGEEGQKEYLAAIARDTRDALKTAIGDADWAKDMLDTLGDSVTLEGLGSVVAQINQAKAAFTSFGQYMPTFAGLAQSAVSAMVDAAGGVDPLAQGMAAFVENFYSDAEKLAVNTENVRAALEGLGFDMPKTRDEFKALVQAQLALGDAGAKTAAGLLGLSGAFAAVTPAAESAQASIASVSDQLRDAFGMTADAVSGILSDAVKNAETASEAQRMASQAFEDKFYGGALDGLTDSLGAMIQSSVIAPMMESLIAGSAASASMLASGGAVAAGAMASGGAAGGAASAAGGSSAAGAMASGGASAANAMVSGGSAAGAIVASAVEQARAQVNAYTQILSDPDVQAGIKDISKLMGEVAGMTFAAKSSWGGGGYSAASFNASGAGSEADKLAESLKRLGETVSEEIKRLAGLMNETDPQKNRAALLAEFAVATAKARAGDQDALSELTDMSKAIEAATKLTAATALDLSTTRGWLASSLEDTLKALNLELPKFDVGTNYVPRTMAAIVHEGEAIVPKAFNPWAGGQGAQMNTARLEALVERLTEENRQQAGEIARLNLRMTRVLERWDGGGLPQEREETA